MKHKRILLIATASVLLFALVAVGIACFAGPADGPDGGQLTGTADGIGTGPATGEKSDAGTDTDTQPDADTQTGAGTPDAQTDGSEDSGAPTVLRIAVARSADKVEQKKREALLDAFIEGFAAANPGVTAQAVYYTTDTPATLTSGPDGTGGYDLVLCTAEQMIGYVYGQSADLTEDILLVRDGLLESALTLGRFEDKQLFVPFCYDRAVLYADGRTFEKLGVGLPAGTLDYEQYEDLIVRLTRTEEDGSRYVGVYMPYYMPYVWMMYCRGFGGEPVSNGKMTLASGKNYEALSRMFTVLDYGYARSFWFSAYGSDTATCALAVANATTPTYDGRLVVNDDYVLSNPARNADALLESGDLVMLSLPSFDGQYRGTSNSKRTYGFAVVSDTARREEAVRLVRYALSDEGQRLILPVYGGIPVNKAVWNEDFWRVGYLSCRGSDSVLCGIEQDRPDSLNEYLKVGESFYADATRLKALEWVYYYEKIGRTDKTVRDFSLPYLKDFQKYANQLLK